MNLRNKKKLGVLVVAFLAFVIAGSAYAFASQGPLVFNGRANVDASLLMLITGYRMESTNMAPDQYDFLPFKNGDSWETDGLDGLVSVTWNVLFTAPGQYINFRFRVTNLGTIPARITDIQQELWGFYTGHPPFDWDVEVTWTNEEYVKSQTVEPGDFIYFYINALWNPNFNDEKWADARPADQPNVLSTGVTHIRFNTHMFYGMTD